MFFVKKWPNDCDVVINVRQQFSKERSEKAIMYSAEYNRTRSDCWYECGQDDKSRNAQADGKDILTITKILNTKHFFLYNLERCMIFD